MTMHFAIAAAVVAFSLVGYGERVTTALSGDDWTVDGEPCTVPHTWNAVDGADGFGDPLVRRALQPSEFISFSRLPSGLMMLVR